MSTTCSPCLNGRHIRCDRRESCACNVCAAPKRRRTRQPAVKPVIVKPTDAEGRLVRAARPTTKPRRRRRTRPDSVMSSNGFGVYEISDDEIRAAVLTLVTRISEKCGIAA